MDSRVLIGINLQGGSRHTHLLRRDANGKSTLR